MQKWLERHLYSDLHEYFFSEFSIILYEWLAILTYRKTNFQGGEPTGWTPELIQQLQEVDNKASRVVEFWLDTILEGYITEFTVDIIKYYSEAESEFFNGPRGRFLLSLQFSIKMIICEKGILKMNFAGQKFDAQRPQVSQRQGLDIMIPGRWREVTTRL